MQPKYSPTLSWFKTGFLALLLLAAIAPAQADDKKADLVGAWSWTTPARGQAPERKMTIKFKMDGDKLVGKLTTPGRDGTKRETDLTDIKVTGEEITFTVTQERGGNKFTTKYSGKIGTDSIKGKIEFERNGETQSRDWETKRDKDADKS